MAMILAAVAVCCATAACSKKSSLYLEPGRAADAAGLSAKGAPRAQPPSMSPPEVQKASHVESAQR
jgi:hypothetical protein